MISFDYSAFRDSVVVNAQTEGSPTKFFLADFDEVMGRIASSAQCVKPSDLYLRNPLKKPELLKHILGCDYCRRFVKLMWLAYETAQEKEKMLLDVYKEKIPANLDLYINELFEEKQIFPTEDCYSIPYILAFNRLSRERKAHRTMCSRCDLTVEFFQKMPLPELQ